MERERQFPPSELYTVRLESLLLRLVPILGYLLMQGLLLTDVIQKGTGFGKAGVVSLLASLTVWFLFHFAREIERGGSLHIESHWGGLGGGVGGFRISRSILYLTGAICFGVLLVLAYYPPPFPAAPVTSAAKGDQTKKDKTDPAKIEQTRPAEVKK